MPMRTVTHLVPRSAARSHVTDLVRVDDLPAYLAEHGLRVVRGGWRWGEHNPYLIVAVGPLADRPQALPERVKGEADDDDG
jgi:hypothetical protein